MTSLGRSRSDLTIRVGSKSVFAFDAHPQTCEMSDCVCRESSWSVKKSDCVCRDSSWSFKKLSDCVRRSLPPTPFCKDASRVVLPPVDEAGKAEKQEERRPTELTRDEAKSKVQEIIAMVDRW